MRFWNFVQNDAGEPELRISGEIVDDGDAWLYEWFGIPSASPNKFRKELAKHAGKDITVWIDSPGGDVFAGAGIYTALMEHKGTVTVKIDGKAFSAASIIAMAGGEVLMSPPSLMLIHNPWSEVRGDSKDMRHVADLLDEVKEAIMNAYIIKTGLRREEISELMDQETPMSPKTAIQKGFADGMLYSEADEAVKDYILNTYRPRILNSWDLSIAKAIRLKQSLGETPENVRVLNKKRISVREKIHRRYQQHG